LKIEAMVHCLLMIICLLTVFHHHCQNQLVS